METKAEWQDYEKAEDKTVHKTDLADMWTPASGSTITITTDVEGLSFDLHVGPKEYHIDTKKKRKPTSFGATYSNFGVTVHYPYIPQPDAGISAIHARAWHHKFTWASAVKELLTKIIPAYENQGETMCLRAVAFERNERQMPEMSEARQEEAPAA